MSDDIPSHADQIRVNGYTVLEDLLPHSFIEELRTAFDRILEDHRRETASNRGANRFQMYLPFEPPFADRRLYENPAVMEIVRQVLGPDPACLYFASDTPLPGADYQRVHSDTRLLFPEVSLSLPCYGLVLNVPLVDVTEENGPMEAWPGGTHLWPGGGDMAALAEVMPHGPLLMNAGSALIRDLRMWHRGTPNRSKRSRPNLALVYTRPWYRFEQRVPTIPRPAWEALSDSARSLFRHAELVEPARPAADPIRKEKAQRAPAADDASPAPREEPPEDVPASPWIRPLEPWADAGGDAAELLYIMDHGNEVARKEARDQLERRRGPELMRALTAMLERAETYDAFRSAASGLANHGGEEAVSALAHQARTRPELALTAINALSECRHPGAVLALIELLQHARRDQRAAAAAALGRCGGLRAIEPLCAIAADEQDTVCSDAGLALRQMGRPADLARRVLADPNLTVHDHVRILEALARAMRFNAPRFLERESRFPNDAVREQARRAAELLREQTTLLRSSAPDDSTLLRPAQSADASSDRMLRPAAEPP